MTKNNCCVQNESNSGEHKQKTPLFYRLIHNEWVETVKNLTGADQGAVLLTFARPIWR